MSIHDTALIEQARGSMYSRTFEDYILRKLEEAEGKKKEPEKKSKPPVFTLGELVTVIIGFGPLVGFGMALTYIHMWHYLGEAIKTLN